MSAPLGKIDGVTLDASGNAYVSDPDNNLILKISRDGVVTIVAGNRIAGFSGDGGPATSASIFAPGGLAVDVQGNVFFADTGNNRVRKVTAGGTISTVAGTGVYDFSGDGGPAANAALNVAAAVAVDANGNLFIVDRANARIRKVTPDGIITTFAGNGRLGFSGDGGLATSAMLNQPGSVAVDSSGNVFLTDESNCRVRKITPQGIISTVAGNGTFTSSGDGGPALSAGINQPTGLTVDITGRIYIVQSLEGIVRKVSADGTIVTIAGNGTSGFSGDGSPAVSASLNEPNDVAVDASGNVYIADTYNSRVRRVAVTSLIDTVAGNGQFNFGGDNGPATSAALAGPDGIALDSAGNVFVADTTNSRIRRIGTDGTITTVAGTGACCFGGDGGPAVKAQIYIPQGVGLDRAGNLLIADSGNHRVRRVTADGIINTIAGAGGGLLGGFSGDGGPATSALMRIPSSVVADQAGNLYIADYADNRIRTIALDGTISTFAGNGKQAYSGDGGPAIAASLYGPYALTFDPHGNLYVAENNNRVRKITPGGIISTVVDYSPPSNFRSIPGETGIAIDAAGNLLLSDRITNVVHVIPPNPGGPDSTTRIAGNGSSGFSGDGGLAAQAALSGPAALALDSTGALYIADSGNGRIRKVLANRPAIQAAPGQLQFAASSGGAVTPVQQISLSGSIPGLAFSAQSAAPWLQLTPEAGSTPRLIDVTADPSGLKAGTYSASIAISAPNATPVLTTVTVTFTVADAQIPKLAIDKQSLSFPFPKNGKARGQTLILSNSGSGSLAFTAAAKTNTGGAWLSVAPGSGQVLPSSPVTLTVTADPTGLAPGTYTGSVSINDVTVPVTMTISSSNQAILLSQTGLSFLGVSQGGIVPPQSFGVINIGTGVVNWTVTKSTLSGGSDWLQVGTASGSTDAASTQVPSVAVTVNAAVLSAGKYYGVVQVNAPNAANSPQVVTIFLQVLAAGSDIGAVAQPSELLFAAPGAGSPGSQDLLLYNIAATPKTFRSTVSTDPGLRVVVLPADGTLDPQAATRVAIQPFTDGLAPGVYQGTVALQFSDGRVRSLRFSVVVPKLLGAGINGTAAAQATCTPTKLLTALTTLGQLFTVSAGWPVALGVDVRDDCGAMLDAGSVSVNFSNGDNPIALQSVKNGHWEATWPTRAGSAAQVILKVKASNASGLLGESDVAGALQADTDPPVFGREGVVSVASVQPFQALAPGSIISIYGNRLADNTDQAQSAPLPTQLGNASVVIAGQIAPLFYVSQNQMNAQIPVGVNPNTTQQILVQRGVTLSQPIAVDVAPAQPSIFVAGGSAIAIDYRNPASPFFVSSSAQATVGDTLVMFCSGLGATNPPVAEGTASPIAPPAQTASPVVVTIGGVTAAMQFAGLAPGFVGLYQVNLAVPAGVSPSDAAPVVVSVAGQSSATVGLAVR